MPNWLWDTPTTMTLTVSTIPIIATRYRLDTRMGLMSVLIVFRRIVAVVLVLVLLVVFTVSMAVTIAVRAVSDESIVPDVVRDAGVYDFAYDDVLNAVISDLVTRGIELADVTGTGKTTIRFDDPEQAKAAIKTFIVSVLPREYVEREVDQAFAALVPYLTGKTDEFAIDLETSERIKAVPAALRAASAQLSLGELVSRDIVSDLVRQRIDDLVLSTLGITLTEQEAVDAAVRIMPPEWIEQRLFEASDELARYFAGETDSFEINVPLRDRAKIVGDILKEKMREDRVVESIVFDQVAGPLVQRAIGGIKVLSYNIEVTPAEIDAALRTVAPPEWLNAEGDRALDAVIAYLTSETDNLELDIDLKERKAAAVVLLKELAEAKLSASLKAIPSCESGTESQLAIGDIAARRVPRCQPFGLDLASLAAPFVPLLLNDIDGLVATSIPDRVIYTDADFRAALGADAIATLNQVRDITSTGITFGSDDLFENIPDPAERARVRDAFDTVRAGAAWDQDDLWTAIDDPSARDAFEKVRSYGRLITPLKAGAIALPLLVALLIALLGGRTWPDRAIWASSAIVVVALAFFLAAHFAGGYAQDTVRRELDSRELIDASFRDDFPATANLIESPKTADKVVGAVALLTDMVRDTARPWLIGGVLAVAASITWKVARPRPSERRNGDSSEAPQPLQSHAE